MLSGYILPTVCLVSDEYYEKYYGKNMNIMIALDDAYVLPTSVMLKSLTVNNKNVHVYTLYLSLSDESKAFLKKSLSNEATIDFCPIGAELFDDFTKGKVYPKEACFRLVGHVLLPPTLDRILWLDGDIIVRGDVSGFYEQDFGDAMFIATIDAWDPSIKKRGLCIPETQEYVNAGVLLFNLEKVREQMSLQKINWYIDEINDKTKYDFPFLDQDIINGLFGNQIHAVREGYKNNFPVIFSGPIANKKSLKKSLILHYCSPRKPWSKKKTYCYMGYWEYLKYAKIIPEAKKLFRTITPKYLLLHFCWLIHVSLKVICRKEKPVKLQ